MIVCLNMKKLRKLKPLSLLTVELLLLNKPVPFNIHPRQLSAFLLHALLL